MNHFMRTSESDSTATCKLTAVSAAIGRQLILKSKTESRLYEQLSLGDLVLEALYKTEYINIYRPDSIKQIEWDEWHKNHPTTGPRPESRTPYMVESGPEWHKIAKLPAVEIKKFLEHTTFQPIKPIDLLFQANSSPVIKHWGYSDIIEFQTLLQEPFVRALDKLQSTGWVIDGDILKAVKDNKNFFVQDTLEVYDSDGVVYDYCIFGNNDSLPSDLIWNDAPFNPSRGNKTVEKKYYSDLRRAVNKKKTPQKEIDKLQKKYDEAAIDWNARLVLLKNRSKFDSYTMTVKKADALLNSVFYQYLDCDYRGRFYYKESYLNFQGKDIERGMLKFAEEKAVTEIGLRYLAIHTANSYNKSYEIHELPDWLTTDYSAHLKEQGLDSISVDKMTLDDRVLWVENNWDLIVSTWNDRVIHDCEKPVMFLACCKELVQIIDEGRRTTQMPIPIDGSNNGWQHLAAMSKDRQAGELVGLIPTDIQKDFYVETAKALIARMPDWFEEKQMPMKDIRKGISKRGSMTRAYSAGPLAIALNMYADVYQEGFHSKYGITMTDCNNLAHKLTRAIDDVCPGPLETMAFLQALAEHIIVSEKYAYITWTTPSGFPVRYENYVQDDVKFRNTISGIGQIGHVGKEYRLIYGEKIASKGGFASGISPNFVHSMDAAHLALIVDYWGGTIATVHDSYATHMGDIPELLDITKDVFVNMYNHEDFYQCIKEMMLDNPDEFIYNDCTLGDLDVKEVYESDYFFS